MKKININDYVFVKITEQGWKHLKETVGQDYIDHCIDNDHYRFEIKGEIWHKFQIHTLFDLLPNYTGRESLFENDISFSEKDLVDI